MDDSSLMPVKGIVTYLWNERHFGFVKDGSGQEYFFHGSAVCDCEFKDLREGMKVEFFTVCTAKGFKAVGIVPLQPIK